MTADQATITAGRAFILVAEDSPTITITVIMAAITVTMEAITAVVITDCAAR